MSAAAVGASVPNACVALAHPTPLVQIARAGSIPRTDVVIGSQFVIAEQNASRGAPISMISSAPSCNVEGGEEIHECEYPDSHLSVKVSKQRGATTPDHPSNSTRKEKGLAAILALVFAATL